jgi:rod shape-determining protein MreC
LSADSRIAAGDTVFTSGQDGVLPKGLKIGVVAVDGPTFVVEPFAGFEGLEYVSVLLFDGPASSSVSTPAAAVPKDPPRAALAEE